MVFMYVEGLRTEWMGICLCFITYARIKLKMCHILPIIFNVDNRKVFIIVWSTLPELELLVKKKKKNLEAQATGNNKWKEWNFNCLPFLNKISDIDNFFVNIFLTEGFFTNTVYYLNNNYVFFRIQHLLKEKIIFGSKLKNKAKNVWAPSAGSVVAYQSVLWFYLETNWHMVNAINSFANIKESSFKLCAFHNLTYVKFC